MSTIAKRVRLSKYDGGTEVPNLMELGDDQIKEGGRFYMHGDASMSIYNYGWHYVVPFEIFRVRRGYVTKQGSLIPLYVVAAWVLPNGARDYTQFTNMSLFLNKYFLPVPSEKVMVLQMLRLLPEHQFEVLEYLELDMPRLRREQLRVEAAEFGR